MPLSTEGRWSGLTRTPGDSRTTGDGLGVFVIHAVLLRTGNVLWFSGHAETVHYLAESYVWDPTQPVSTATRQSFPAGTDIFCCHHANLDDGRVITVGGAMAHPNHGRGIKAICVFDPSTSTWTKIGEMQEARWYPTLVTLPDGRLVVFSGRKEAGTSDLIAATVELLSPPFTGPGYTTQTLAGANKTFPTYPGLHLVPGGRVFHTGTTWRYENPVSAPIGTFSFRVTGPTTGAWTDESVSPHVDFREEGMSVLLPPAQDGKILLLGGAKVNLTSGGGFSSIEPGSELRAAEVVDTKTNPPTWTRIADMAHPRINLNAALLPDGKVLVLGGHNQFKWNATSTPSNQAELYDPVLDAWTPAATLNESRTYHSSALLLPDGRVVVAGGVDPTQAEPGFTAALNRKTLEFYEPPYFFNPDDSLATRPSITNVIPIDGPADQIAYGGQFLIDTPSAADIRRVVLMKPGAMTHHTDSEQRYVPLDFVPVSATQLRVAVVGDPTVAPPGYYMLWIVDRNGRPCQRARFVRLTRQRCFVITDRSHFSKDEVAPAPATTTFDGSFYVVMDGFLPGELGITPATPTNPPPAGLAPDITFRREDESVVGSLSAAVGQLLYEDPALPPGVRQRFTFKYAVNILGTADFFQPDGVTPIETQDVFPVARHGAHACRGKIRLTHQPNPYLLDGATSWLSIDLRVFQIRQGESRFGQTMGATPAAAIGFIQGALAHLNSNPAAGHTEFEALSTDPNVSRLALAVALGGQRVFNFAIAQVRFRGRTLPANDVRVFFRLFTTVATGLEYRDETYPIRSNPLGEPIAVLGIQGGEISTIPFFAEPRVHPTLQSLTEQRDPTNRRDIAATGGAETFVFFGCWLDLNQTELRFPRYPGGLGPYASGLQSILQLIHGRHQCLVAELNFASDPIPPGATPGDNDNLSQRNLAFVESDNPGSDPTHTVAHTFVVRPSPSFGVATPATHAALLIRQENVRRGKELPPLIIPSEVDELLIHWRNLPKSTEVTLFMPDVAAEEILQLARRRLAPWRLLPLDPHTLACPVGDITYVPLPGGRVTDIPALLTMKLPADVRREHEFRVVVQQMAGVSGAIIGSFEVVVRVSTARVLVANEMCDLAVMRHIAESIPPKDRWHPIFERYLKLLAERVRGFGGDPDKVQPSPRCAGRDPREFDTDQGNQPEY